MKLIDKDALVAEIKKLKAELPKNRGYKRNAYNHVLHIIDSFEVKEVDLEREIQVFAKMDLEPLEIYDANIGISITMSQLYKCARHFFELGLKAQKGE
jgi:hypothetical protein